MSERYYTETPITGQHAILGGAEAHHLIHVMRAKVGSQVTLFDGSGSEFPAEVKRLGRAEVELAIVGRREIDRELPRRVTLAVALPKGDRQKWLAEKATELGVARLVPLVTSRAVADPGGQAVARLQRAVIEAAKQCGRNRLMEIAAPQRWPDFLAAADALHFRWLAHPGALGVGPPMLSGSQEPVTLAIGPEGGFTEEEVAHARAAGWQLIDLGPRILRVETAAILLAAMVVGQVGNLPPR